MGGLGEGLGVGLIGGWAQQKQRQFDVSLGQQANMAKVLLDASQKPSGDPGQQAKLLGAAYQVLTTDPKKLKNLKLADLLGHGGQAGQSGQPMSEQTPIGGSSTMPPRPIPPTMVSSAPSQASPIPPPPQGMNPIMAANAAGALPPAASSAVGSAQQAAFGGQQPAAQAAVPAPPGSGQGSNPFAGLSFLTPAQQQASMYSAQTDAEIAGRKKMAEAGNLKEGTPEYQRYMATGNLAPIPRLQAKNVVLPGGSIVQANYDNLTGQLLDQNGMPLPEGAKLSTASAASPKKIIYRGPNNEPLFGFQVGSQLFSQDSQALPQGTQAWEASLIPSAKTSSDIRFVQQPDGSTVPVPVTKTEVTTRGVPPPPGETQSGIGSTATPRSGASVGKPGAPVGGKTNPAVAKSFDTLNQSQERLQVMQTALPDAMKGDQQAMVNLLYNHIGMTTGLQKGARITQTIVDEAQKSAPLSARILARIGVGNTLDVTPTILSGIVLTPGQMNSMVRLAQERVAADQNSYNRVRSAVKGNYGMGNGVPAPPSGAATPTSPKTSPQKSAAPKTWNELKAQLAAGNQP